MNNLFNPRSLGKITASSKTEYLRIIDTLTDKGAEAIILGCTEIGMLVTQADTDIPLFDSTVIHAEKAVDYALRGPHTGS